MKQFRLPIDVMINNRCDWEIMMIEGMVAAWLLDLLLGLCIVTECFSGSAYYRYVMVTTEHRTAQQG